MNTLPNYPNLEVYTVYVTFFLHAILFKVHSVLFNCQIILFRFLLECLCLFFLPPNELCSKFLLKSDEILESNG